MSGPHIGILFPPANLKNIGDSDLWPVCLSDCRPLNVGLDAVGLVRRRLLCDLGAPAAAQFEAEGRRRLLEGGLSLALPFKGQSHMRLKRTSEGWLLN